MPTISPENKTTEIVSALEQVKDSPLCLTEKHQKAILGCEVHWAYLNKRDNIAPISLIFVTACGIAGLGLVTANESAADIKTLCKNVQENKIKAPEIQQICKRYNLEIK